MTSVNIRLWVMMFLQYFTWGAWFVTMGSYIFANTGEGKIFSDGFIGAAYSTSAIGAMIAPFFVGMIADRFLPTQYVLAFLHFVGAGVLYWLSTITDQATFFLVLILYFVCYMPTLALTNSLAFTHVKDAGKEFPWIRVGGTIGWIVAGWMYLFVVAPLFYGDMKSADAVDVIQNSTTPMLVAVASSVALAVFCLILPHTPPPKKGKDVTVGDIVGFDALKLMGQLPFAVFVIGSFLISIPLQFYYSYTNAFLGNVGVSNAVGVMTFGQMSEIFFMLLMPFFFIRLGVKWMLLFGMGAWLIRYLLFAFGAAGTGWADPQWWMLFVGILLHGICYDFFFVTGYIYVDNKTDPSVRGAAQGFIAFVTLGIGAFIGMQLSGVADTMLIVKNTDAPNVWTWFWVAPAIFAGVVMALFFVLFNDKETEAKAIAEEKGEKTPPLPDMDADNPYAPGAADPNPA